MTTLAIVLFTLFYLLAIVGIVLPVLPGIPLAALGALLAGWLTGFEQLTVGYVIWVIALAVLAQLVDFLGNALGAKRFGASRAGLWGGIIGSLVGLVWFPPLGFLLGALAGAVLAELLTGRRLDEALRSGVGALVGAFGGMVAKFLIVIAIGVLVFPRFF